MTTITIAEASKLYQEGISPSFDWKNLSKDFLAHVMKNDYPGSVTKPESFESTFHPLGVPITIKEAVERYKMEGEIAVDPSIREAFECIKEHNQFCDRGIIQYDLFGDTTKQGDKLNEIKVTDYMNFLYFANEVVKTSGYHNPIKLVRPGIIKSLKKWDTHGFRESFKKEKVHVKDPNPIIIMSNSLEDGLIDIFKDELESSMIVCNRGLRVFNLGGDKAEESLRGFYSNPKIKDFDYVNCQFKPGSSPYFGIWTEKSSMQGSFIKKHDLLGIENNVNGIYVFDRIYVPIWGYEKRLGLFNELKDK